MVRSYFTLLFFFSVAVHLATAQSDTRLDSLLRVNQQNKKTDSSKFNLLIDISKEYNSVNPGEGVSYASAAIDLARQLNKVELLALAHRTKGINLAGTGQMEAAMKDFEQAAAYYEKSGNKNEAARCNMSIGVMHGQLSDLPTALEYFFKTLHIYEQTGSQADVAGCLGNIANAYYFLSDNVKALEYYQKAYAINKTLNNIEGIFRYYNNVGALYMKMANYPRSLEYFQQALNWSETLGAKTKKADILNNIGVLYGYLLDLPKSLEYTQKSLEIQIGFGDQRGAAMGYVNLGSRYLKMNKLDKAEESYRTALQYLEKINDPGTLANCLSNLAQLYEKKSDYKQAFLYHEKALTAHKASNQKEGITLSMNGLAKLYREAPDSVLSELTDIPPADRLEQSESVLLQSIAMAQPLDLLESLKDSWYELSLTYEKMENYPKAYEAFIKHIEYRDSILGEATRNQITRKEIQFEFDKKEIALNFEQQLTLDQLEKQKLLSVQQQQALRLTDQALTISNKEKDLQHLAYLKEKAEKQEKEQLLALAEKDKQLQASNILTLANEKALQLQTLAKKNALIGFLLASLLALLLAALTYYLWQRQKRIQKETQAQAQFTRQLLENTEEERSRIARDLHDGVSHELLSLRREIQHTNATERIDHIINDIRQISRNLHPVMLESIGLQLSLETLCEQYMEHDQLFISHEIDYHKTLPIATELQIFRIVQEALTNTIKYANANAALVRIHTSPDRKMQVIIQDNGKGFDVTHALESGKSFGLHSILQRSKAMGAVADIQSSRQGTVIQIKIPKHALIGANTRI